MSSDKATAKGSLLGAWLPKEHITRVAKYPTLQPTLEDGGYGIAGWVAGAGASGLDGLGGERHRAAVAIHGARPLAIE